MPADAADRMIKIIACQWRQCIRIMADHNRLALLLVSIVVTVCVAQLLFWGQYRKYKFPPSPPGRLPIIGHAHLLPKRLPGDKAKKWGS
jgi:hypothetical protein